jgi:hypothetical protein
MTETAEPFSEWAIVELMGRIRLAGHLTEQQIAGGHFLRLDIHKEEGPAVITQLIPPPPGGPVYRITITTEAVARKIGGQSVPEPVARWELEPAKPFADDDDDDDDEPLRWRDD